ncbi:NRR repressor homolog 1-like [Oryza brachyantha]|uniref:NRR repressor homolog 1-like n=1 Tax=Oryza brachyantha TaxID=4533 RepID=UPI001AD97740|nr:NRR repressor homolog 1-like [Oryza brachyantha]
MEGMGDAVAGGVKPAPPLPGCGGAAASTPLSERRGEEEEVVVAGEDEQMERFYALVANIRAMRGMYMNAAAGGGGQSDKRARCAEPPWRPAFRMEDFEPVASAGDVGDDAACSSKSKKQRGAEHGATAPAARRRTEKAAAGATDDEEEDGEVVEGKEHRLAASRRAGPLTS